MGIRDRAEAGPGIPLPLWPDLVWFFSIVLSGLVIAANIFTCRGVYKILRPAVLGALWLVTLFILNPRPVYGIILFAITVTTTWVFYHLKNKSI
jgi:hypothetical protein